MRTFNSGATRDDDDNKMDYEGFISPFVLERFAAYMHKHRKQADGKLRDSDNWQKGIPIKQYMKSLMRHVVDAWRLWRSGSTGDDFEEALCAIMFNVQGILFELRSPCKECGNTPETGHKMSCDSQYGAPPLTVDARPFPPEAYERPWPTQGDFERGGIDPKGGVESEVDVKDEGWQPKRTRMG